MGVGRTRPHPFFGISLSEGNNINSKEKLIDIQGATHVHNRGQEDRPH